MNTAEVIAERLEPHDQAVRQRIERLELEAQTCRKAARALKEIKELYQDFYDGAPDMFLSIDPRNGKILDCNQTLADELGYDKEALIGSPVADLFDPNCLPAQRSAFHQFRTTGEVAHARLTLRRRDDTTFDVILKTSAVRDESGLIVRSRTVLRDVADLEREAEEERRRQTELLETQRLESLGTLAGGVAHNFNNLFTEIAGNAELARLELDPSHPAVRELNEILEAVDRGGNLSHQILAYSGGGAFRLGPTSLATEVQAAIDLHGSLLRGRVTVALRVNHAAPPVIADRIQIQQLVVNLILNAMDAQECRGTIRVWTGQRFIDDEFSRSMTHPGSPLKGLAGFVEVADTGCGMDQETLGRIFDPFFTTKFAGRGLGLAAVLGIVRVHGGALTVSSRPGEGSTFTVYLPAA